MKFPIRSLALALALASLPHPAHAQEHDIVIETPGERSSTNKLAIGGVTGAGVIAGAIGLYFHLDSRSAANDVTANKATGKAWSPAKMELVNRAHDSRTSAIIGYSIGGALVIAAVIAFIATDPPSETTVIHPHKGASRPQPTVAPTEGGGVVGGMWSF